MDKTTIVTTSWDDGHPCDLRLALELAERSLPGTFYVPLRGEEHKPVLQTEALLYLHKQGFEIGAHTFSHSILPGLEQKELSREVCDSKQMLEEQLGSEVHMFCYPRGRYDPEVIACVQRSGFEGARTTRMLAHTLRFSRFEMPTSLQAYPHSPLNYLKNLARHRDWTGIGRYVQKYMKCRTWTDLGRKLFDEVLLEGGVWHLYGHSWEIQGLGLWDELCDLLEYVAHHKGVIYASNGRVIELMCERTSRVGEAA